MPAKNSISRLFSVLLMVTFLLKGVLPMQMADAVTSKPAALPVAQLLNPDGTLNLSAGYSGNLDITDYGVSLDPARGPIFRPLASAIGWQPVGQNNLNGAVNAIALDSNGDLIAGGFFTDANLPLFPLQNADYIAHAGNAAWLELSTTPLSGAVNVIVVSGTDVYVGGYFVNAGGNANADYIAKWNGSAWSALGADWGIASGNINAIAISGSDVYVGGSFSNATGDSNMDNIAKFNGSTWSALDTGLNGIVNAIAVSGADVYAGGAFTDAGGDTNADKIAKFSGGTWSALAATPLNGTVQAIVINGADLYAGGYFTDAGGVAAADFIAKFDGSVWSALGAGVNGFVNAIAIHNGYIYAGGALDNAGGDANADFIAKFDGSIWSSLNGTAPLTNGVNTIFIDGNGIMYVGGSFTNQGLRIVKWNSSNTWEALGATSLNNKVYAITISGTDVYAGGDFTNAGGIAAADYVAKFNGTAWSALGATPLGGGSVRAIAVSGSNVYVGGDFIDAGGVAAADHIAKFNGSVWSALGATPLNNIVRAIAINGTDIYAGGDFLNAGGVAAADYIAKFNGSIWSALGGIPLTGGPVRAIVVSGSNIYAGGNFLNAGGVAAADFIAKFNGTSWSALGTTPLNGAVNTILINGLTLYAGGAFTNAGGVAAADYIAKFYLGISHNVWSALGATPLGSAVNAIAISGGDVYAGGSFTNAGGDANADYIARFDGSAWFALSAVPLNNFVNAISISGLNVYAGGDFTNASFIVRNKIPFPAVSSIIRANPNPSAASSVDFTVSFTKSVTGVDATDFNLTTTGVTGAAIASVSGSGATRTVTVNTGTGSGAIRLDLTDNDSILDTGLNPLGGPGAANGNFNTGQVYTIDKTTLMVLSSLRLNPNPTKLVNISFSVTFSASVTGVDTADFSLTANGVTGASITGVSGSGATRTVSVNTGSGNGTIRLNVIDNDTILGPTSNPLGGTGAGNGNFTAGQIYTVDKTVTLTLNPIPSQDGWVLESGENSNVGGAINATATTFNLGDDATKKQYRAILSFNTGANLPDTATITGVTLKLKQNAILGGGNPIVTFQGFMVDIKNGFFGATALQTTDFQTLASHTYGPFSPSLVSSFYSINLTGGKVDINKLATNSGLTQIRLRFKLDDNNNTVANILSLFSGNVVSAADRPQLVITYVP